MRFEYGHLIFMLKDISNSLFVKRFCSLFFVIFFFLYSTSIFWSSEKYLYRLRPYCLLCIFLLRKDLHTFHGILFEIFPCFFLMIFGWGFFRHFYIWKKRYKKPMIKKRLQPFYLISTKGFNNLENNLIIT